MNTLNPKYMSFNEMQTNFPNCWILVANPDSEPASAEIKSGYFLYKNKVKKKVLEKSKEIKIAENFIINLIRIIYTGEIKTPINQIVCL